MKRFLLCWLLAFIPLLGSAADLAPDGALARWLDEEAGPQLARTLARHPRVAGEPVAFSAVVDGVPIDTRDDLRAAIERRLRAHLLRTSGVRLALPRPPSACEIAPGAQLLIGIDVRRSGRRGGEVSLGLLDVAEGHWVSGIALAWRGALDAVERDALARTSMTGVPGTSAHPFARDDVERIAQALHERIACGAPPTATGRIFVEIDEDAVDARIAAAFLAGFSGSPRWTPVSDAAAARWRLQLHGDGAASAAVEALRVTLVPTGGDSGQIVAVVFHGAAASYADRAPVTPVAPAVVRAPELLGAVAHDVVRRQGICARGDRDARCVEVSMDLEQDAWLVVATSQAGRVHALSCEPPGARSEAGERRWRLTVAPSRPGRPSAGLYVLATRDGSVARALARIVSEAPGACGGRSTTASGPWIDVLARFVDVHRRQLDWRVVHLAQDPNGRVERIGPAAALAQR